MKNKGKILFTKSGLQDFKKEYNYLLEKKRPEAVKRMARAKDLGDLTENSEYTAAREDLSFIDGRLSQLREILKQAKSVSKGKNRPQSINLGCKVTLYVNGKKEIFTIVGEWEANPSEKKISHNSPLGKALLGKRKGDEVKVSAPAGKIIYKIIEID